MNINDFESDWNEPDGFFFKLRQGIYEENRTEYIISKYAAIDFGESKSIDRRIVSLLWYVPLFLSWQVERVENNESYKLFCNKVNQYLKRS